MPSGDAPRKGRAGRQWRPCPARRRPTRGRGSTSHEGRPRCLPHQPGWTGPTRPSRSYASSGARVIRPPRSAGAWTPPRTRSWARPIACSCRRDRRRSEPPRLIDGRWLHASPCQSWRFPASCLPPSCQHRLLSPLPSTLRPRRPPGGPAHASGRSASLAGLASTCAATTLRRASRTAPATAAAPTCAHATLPTPSPRPDGEQP